LGDLSISSITAAPSVSEDDILIGIYKTFEEAEEAALLSEKSKTEK
jgi:hypothetical protein